MEKTGTIWTSILGIFERISFWGILAVTALLPVFFIPSYFFPLQNAKAAMFAIAAAFCLFTLLLKFLVEGKVTVQKSPATWAFVLLALFSLVSAYFSSSRGMSLIGDGNELDTSAFLIAFAAVLLSVPAYFADKKRIFYFYFAFLFSFVVLAVFHILRFAAGPNFLAFGFFTDPASSPIGGWNDVAVFSGVAALFAVIGLETRAFGGFLRGLLYAVLPLALILLAVVNFAIGWIVLALFALAFAAYFFFGKKAEGEPRRVPYASLALLIVSIVFILGGTQIGGAIASGLHIFKVEARPLWTTTYSIAKPVVGVAPIFGAGPNRFSYVWQLLKPTGVNATPFWGSSFSFGVGIVPTSVITLGLAGFLLYIVFLVLYLWKGFVAIKALAGRSSLSRFVILTTFAGSLFLWAVAFFYVPGLVGFALAALWTALFFAALQSESLLIPAGFSFSRSFATRTIGTIVLAALMVGSVTFGYGYAKKAIAAAYLQRAYVAQAAEGNPDRALAYNLKALQYSQTALVYRSIEAVQLARLNALIATASDPKTKATEELKNQFTTILTATLDAGKSAITADGVDFRNWVAIGSVYETLVSIGFPNAYENASGAYIRAQALSPMNPEMYLNLARLEFAHASSTAAKDYLSKAFALKNDYVAGIFLLSQIQVAEKDTAGAIKSLTAAANINPTDQTVLYQLGALSYSTGDYKTAAQALEAAVQANPVFSNARYFLGLSYDKLGKSADAIAQFEALLQLNPDNAEIKTILANLKAGKAAVPAPVTPAATTTAPKKK